MAEATIPVDLRNPGQVFACLGLMEAASVLFDVDAHADREVWGQYAWEEGATAARFTLAVDGAEGDPVATIVRFLAEAEVRSLNAPVKNGVAYTTAAWKVPTIAFSADKDEAADQEAVFRFGFPSPPPDSPAALPIQLTVDRRRILISHWADDGSVGRDNVKFWAGAAGYPGAALARDSIAPVAALGGNALAAAAADPFSVGAPQSSCFRFDWRQSYVPLEIGTSHNAHSGVTMVGYPLVELLAAIGLENARPDRPDPRNKLRYRYAVSNARLPLAFARAVLGGQDLGFELRRFRMSLNWPGQEGQARCIVDSREEHE